MIASLTDKWKRLVTHIYDDDDDDGCISQYYCQHLLSQLRTIIIVSILT
ncbi:hypothetical protein N9L68_02665 [bacterium]|nr:hypothetical protein [bacterium]